MQQEIFVLYAKEVLLGVGIIEKSRLLPGYDPHRSNFLYLAVMAFFYLLLMGFYVLDVVLAQGGLEYPTPALFMVWICASAALYAGYRGYFSIKSGKT